MEGRSEGVLQRATIKLVGPLGRSSPLIKTLTDKQRTVEGGESVRMRSKGRAKSKTPEEGQTRGKGGRAFNGRKGKELRKGG